MKGPHGRFLLRNCEHALLRGSIQRREDNTALKWWRLGYESSENIEKDGALGKKGKELLTHHAKPVGKFTGIKSCLCTFNEPWRAECREFKRPGCSRGWGDGKNLVQAKNKLSFRNADQKKRVHVGLLNLIPTFWFLLFYHFFLAFCWKSARSTIQGKPHILIV